jgi:hypothetical protein
LADTIPQISHLNSCKVDMASNVSRVQ